jgi:septum formation protein
MKNSNVNIPNLGVLLYIWNMLEIALCSNSPRRRELLTSAGLLFRLFPVKVSEIFDENLTAEQVASHLATVKGRAAVEQNNSLKSPGYLVLSADTIVVHEGRVLGKPENSSVAAEYLRLLSGKTHRVITGIYLHETGSMNFLTALDQTKVQFRALSESEIQDYIATGEPMDKAGAYGIQGEARKFVSRIEGSWSNVVGLPLEKLAEVLQEKNWHVRRTKS